MKSNSEVILPRKLVRIRGDAKTGMSEMMLFDVFRLTHIRRRFLENLRSETEEVSNLDEYNFFKSAKRDAHEHSSRLVEDGLRLSRVRELLEMDIARARKGGLTNLAKSYRDHYRFAVQVVFRERRHHWDEMHIRELLQPLVQFDRDVSRILFHNRGGRFIIVYCPVLLQALKAVQCIVTNIKNGDSYLFHDAAVVIDYFPVGSKDSTDIGSHSSVFGGASNFRGPDESTSVLRLNRTKERKRRLALKLLGERQVLPRGRNEIDQRVLLVKRIAGQCKGEVPSSELVPTDGLPFIGDACQQRVMDSALSQSVLSSLLPLTRFQLARPAQSPLAVSSGDPAIEGVCADHTGHFLFNAKGDTITHFDSSGPKSLGFTTMRIDLKFVSEHVQLDESPRDYDLLGEDAIPLRQRRTRAIFTEENPPQGEQSNHYYQCSVSGVYFRKCALRFPGMFLLEGDSRYCELVVDPRVDQLAE